MKHSPGFLKLVAEAKQRIREKTVEQVRADLEKGTDLILVDVREDSEWSAGRAKGAIHLGKGIIERDIEQAIPDPKRKIVLYCGGGYRSALAADSLQQMGYTHVYSLAGGWRAWNEAGLPIEEGSAKP
jgi:rhodanese-related sulfurtransferase